MRTPSIPRNWQILLGLTYVVFLLYMTVVMQLLLTTIAITVLVVLFGYLTWRVWRVFRIYEQRLESETDVGEQMGDKSDQDPVDSLKQQYAAGELSDQEFEERLDELLSDDDETTLGEDSRSITDSDGAVEETE